MLAVSLRSATAILGRFPALAGVDLDIDVGETVLVSGPNGAGKSTLLRLLAGLVPLSTGEGRVFGNDLMLDRRAFRHDVAYLGHETLCYDDLTTAENLRFHARAAGKSAGVVDGVLERVGLGRLRGRSLRLLSAGQQRRLALGVVIVRDAPLLLLDEPHAGLDASGRVLLDDLVKSAAADGRTVLMASHELHQARAVTGREVTMIGGQARGGVVDPMARRDMAVTG